MTEFTKVEVPQGRFIGWGRKGQRVTVKVASFDATGGRDFNGNSCPQLIGELTEACSNFKDKGTVEETLGAGELVTVTAGLANLKRGLLAADPKAGDVVRMTFTDTYKTAAGDGKVIEVEIARAAQTVSVSDLA